jgi:hypothetical protein
MGEKTGCFTAGLGLMFMGLFVGSIIFMVDLIKRFQGHAVFLLFLYGAYLVLKRFLRRKRALNADELQLEAHLRSLCITMTPSSFGTTDGEAAERCERLLEVARGDYLKSGMRALPPLFGDLVLSGTDDMPNRFTRELATALRASYEEKVADGMTDDDFRDFWNEHPLTNAFTMAHAGSVFLPALLENMGGVDADLSDDEAAREAWRKTAKTYPVYRGSRQQPLGLMGEDRLLPTELKTRVGDAINERISRLEIEELRTEIDSYTSFNAWAREQIRQGRI